MILKIKNERGFTLIELMIVVAIIGVLASISIPQYIKYIKRTRTSSAVTAVRDINHAVQDWVESSDLGDGAWPPNFQPDFTGVKGINFSRVFPSQSNLLRNGDKFYIYYQFTQTIGGVKDFRVYAVARNFPADDKVFAAWIYTSSLVSKDNPVIGLVSLAF